MLVFFFTDIEGSTRLWEQHTAEMRDVIARHDAILHAQIEGCGGKITKHTGDGVTAVFEAGEPVCCALETQKQFATETWPGVGEVRIRVGMHAGDAELHAGDYFGPAVNCTARIMAAGWGGQILLTPQVDRACAKPANAWLRDLGLHLLKDVSAPQQIYQLVHPDLRWQEFPPLRTLSSSAISRTIEQQAQRLACQSAPAIGAGLVSATLLPMLQGDLTPFSPTLEGNLGLLADLGAYSLRDWLAGFVERVRAKQQAGEAVTELEIRQQLEMELLELWEAGGEAGSVSRADASRLLRAVQGVEAVLQAAPDVKPPLVLGLADLGRQFREFRWMLDGLGETLAEIGARQVLQVAMQEKQLRLEQETLHLATLIHQRLQEAEILDLTRLQPPPAGRERLVLGPPEFDTLVRSALHHGVDLRPWLAWTGPPEQAVRALERGLNSYPKLDDRLRLVAGLESLAGDAATEALLRVARTEEVPEVRAKAAVAAAQRGRAAETMAGLVDGMSGSSQAAALAAFAEVADQLGIPAGIGPYPRASVFLALAWRRWKAKRQMIARQTVLAALSGVVVSVFGTPTPLFYYLNYPEEYYRLIQETFPLASWIFSGALMFLLIGCFQGAASGFALGVADAVWHDMGHRTWRWALGVGSGLALAMLLTVLSFARVSSPEVGAAVFVPLYILCGFAHGAAATIVIPPLGISSSFRRLVKRATVAMLLTAGAAIPYAFLVYPSTALVTLAHRLLFAVGFPLALAFLFGRWGGQREISVGAHEQSTVAKRAE